MKPKHGPVILVDSDSQRAARLSRRLAQPEMDIVIAGDGATGLLQAHERRPSLLVCMPELQVLDGYRLIEAIRCRPETATIPAVLVTEGSGAQELARGWRAGADLCIPLCQGEADMLATLHRLITNECGHVSVSEGAAQAAPC